MVTEPGREKYEIVSEFMENGNIRAFTKQDAGANLLELVSVGLHPVDFVE